MLNNKSLPVSVIIVNFNTIKLTENTISAIYRGTHLPKEVILVDNNSSEKGIDEISKKFLEVILIKNNENIGFARANNRAIQEVVSQPYVWLLNSDTETGKQTLKQLFDFMELNFDTMAISPQIVYADGRLQSTGGFFPSFINIALHYIPIHKVFPVFIQRQIKLMGIRGQKIKNKLKLDYVTGAAMFLRKEIIDKIGLFDADYFMYFEETDLCWRIRNYGYKIFSIDTEPLMHIHGGSFKNKYDSKRIQLFYRSLIFFVKKNYKGIKKHILLLEINIFYYLRKLLRINFN